jgi:hypothetical protein
VSRGQQQQHRGRIEQQRHHQDEPAHDVLVGGAEQGREIPHGAQIGLDDPAVTLCLGLLDLKACQVLCRGRTLSDELAPYFGCWSAKLMAEAVRPLATAFSTAPSIWAMRRSISATTPA